MSAYEGSKMQENDQNKKHGYLGHIKSKKTQPGNEVRLNEPPNKFAKLFLEANGFKLVENNNHFANDMCGVVVNKENYEVANNNGDLMYSTDINIYWLIGVLTWNNYIPRNYNNF